MYKKTRHTASLGIAIKKGHREKGIGTTMIIKAIEWCKFNNIKKLNLEVFSSNFRAIRLYKKHGFVIEGRKKMQFNIDGKYVDDVFMTYTID
ncbi:GCN5-related N-acetyltransferase domain protein [mine drainage metagenome]|uniref:GCN5-related N-acetyltransferase domain protein n=1 Tax=mine drainage metagenome TaxID=410659 RepID=T0Z396_9ZZZZ